MRFSHRLRSGARAEQAVTERPPEITSKIMSAVKNKDSKAELLLRRALFARGMRYRVHYRRLIGSPDIVFPSAKVAIFVDGDFWHGNAWRVRGMASFQEQFRFRSNPEFWEAKIRRNMERDEEVNQQLVSQGWVVLRFWESDIVQNIDRCVARAVSVVETARDTRRSQQRT